MYKQGSRKGTIRFSLPADANAKEALLAGDFTEWRPVRMRKQKGAFAATVPLGTGCYQYKFIVDGCWITDPENNNYAANGLGSMNSVAVV